MLQNRVMLLMIALAVFVATGFSSYEYDQIKDEQFATKWRGIAIVKIWEEDFIDEYGAGINVCIKRPFRNYTLKYKTLNARRMNSAADDIMNKFNTHTREVHKIGGDEELR